MMLKCEGVVIFVLTPVLHLNLTLKTKENSVQLSDAL